MLLGKYLKYHAGSSRYENLYFLKIWLNSLHPVTSRTVADIYGPDRNNKKAAPLETASWKTVFRLKEVGLTSTH